LALRLTPGEESVDRRFGVFRATGQRLDKVHLLVTNVRLDPIQSADDGFRVAAIGTVAIGQDRAAKAIKRAVQVLAAARIGEGERDLIIKTIDGPIPTHAHFTFFLAPSLDGRFINGQDAAEQDVAKLRVVNRFEHGNCPMRDVAQCRAQTA
jgi:hypothetical protein